jgi:hypothetical protein
MTSWPDFYNNNLQLCFRHHVHSTPFACCKGLVKIKTTMIFKKIKVIYYSKIECFFIVVISSLALKQIEWKKFHIFQIKEPFVKWKIFHMAPIELWRSFTHSITQNWNKWQCNLSFSTFILVIKHNFPYLLWILINIKCIYLTKFTFWSMIWCPF